MGILLDETEEEDLDKIYRSARLKKQRRSPRIKKASWINDDLNDLKFMTYVDDRVYKNEDKIEIFQLVIF